MASMRSYEDPCGIARALDLIGERWSLLIVRELLFGPKRFTDLRRGLSGASPNVLAQRLKELEAGGVLRRRKLGASSYELTEWGQQLHPILLRLGYWGAQGAPSRPGPMSVDATMAALEATFSTSAPAKLQGVIELKLDEDQFVAQVDSGRLRVSRGAARAPDARIVTDPATLRAVVFGDRPPPENLGIEGDARLARSFLRQFSRPEIGRRFD